MKLLLDLNVLLDVLAAREPWLEDSASVLGLVAEGRADGYVAAYTITTIHYLASMHLGREQAAAALVDLMRVVRVVTVDHESLLQAFSLGWPDFEDAVQAVCALAVGADYVVTRDAKSFRSLPIPVVNPAELLATLAP